MLLFLKVINIFLEGIVPVKMEMSLVVALGAKEYARDVFIPPLYLRVELQRGAKGVLAK